MTRTSLYDSCPLIVQQLVPKVHKVCAKGPQTTKEKEMDMYLILFFCIVFVVVAAKVAVELNWSDQAIAATIIVALMIVGVGFSVYAIGTVGNSAAKVIQDLATVEAYRRSLTPTAVS